VQVSVIGNPDDTVVITLRGHLDLDSATVLGTTLDQVLDRHHRTSWSTWPASSSATRPGSARS
jgi:hypothetical protein